MRRLSTICAMLIACLCMAAGTAMAQSAREIEAVQDRLTELGYDPGPVDGMLGSQTAVAVEEFQADLGLPVNGEIDLALITLLGAHPDEPEPLETVQARLGDILGSPWDAVAADAAPAYWNPPSDTSGWPAFGDHATATRFSGNATFVDLESHPDARTFQSALARAIGTRPDFAGAYTLVQIGCGTSCQAIALVDARDGAVFFGPTAEAGLDYRADSRLIVVNPLQNLRDAYGDEIPLWAATRFYVFDGTGFREISVDTAGTQDDRE